MSYHNVSSTTKDVYFMPKLCKRLRRKFSFLRVFTGHGKAGKSKKFICQAWIVMELDWPPWKLLVNEISVIEIRYCRCQRKEIACMIEMSNHGTNLIEKQSLCLFDWSTLKRKPITEGKFWEKFTVTASKVIEKVLTFEELKRVQECCELSIWQMTVKLKVIDIRPCLPGVINAIVSEYSSMIFLMYKCTIALLGDHPPSLRSWSTWLSVKRPPFSIAAFRTNLVAKPCKRQKVALELFTHATNYALMDADCVLTAKIGKSCKMEFQLWSVWIEVSSDISHSIYQCHISLSSRLMIWEYSREHNSLIFASTENLCVDLLWQLEFIHMFNTCPITIRVTWRHKECEWLGRYLTVVKVQLQWLENGSSNNGNHYYVPCLLFNWRKYMIQLITGCKQCGFSNIDNDERGFFC